MFEVLKNLRLWTDTEENNFIHLYSFSIHVVRKINDENTAVTSVATMPTL